MIAIKTDEQLERMRAAGRITALARRAAADAVAPGVTTDEIDRIVRKTIEEAGAKPSFLGYGGFPASACISVNDEVIHGIPSRKRVLRTGDLVKIDVGAYIGGFHGGNPQDPAYRELFARWFEWGTFCPVMRVHGDREPRQERLGTTGGSVCCSGGPNEVYAYGEEVLAICTEHLKLRVRLKPYLKECMREAHERGTPVMKPLFYML